MTDWRSVVGDGGLVGWDQTGRVEVEWRLWRGRVKNPALSSIRPLKLNFCLCRFSCAPPQHACHWLVALSFSRGSGLPGVCRDSWMPPAAPAGRAQTFGLDFLRRPHSSTTTRTLTPGSLLGPDQYVPPNSPSYSHDWPAPAPLGSRPPSLPLYNHAIPHSPDDVVNKEAIHSSFFITSAGCLKTYKILAQNRIDTTTETTHISGGADDFWELARLL